MHELGIADEILQISLDSLENQGEGVLDEVHLKLGIFSGIQADNLKFHFDILKKQTKAENAQLIIEICPAVFECGKCKNKELYFDVNYICSKCGKADYTISGGKEMEISSLEATMRT